MGKIRAFYYVFKNSFFSPSYYADILKAPFLFSMKFYWAYFFLFSLVATVYITIRFFLPLDGFLKRLPVHLVNVYPNRLIISINGGKVSTNVEEPYFIPFSSIDPIIDDFEQNVLGESSDSFNNLLVIDTDATVDDFENYKTVALLTMDKLVFINDDGNIEAAPLNDISNVTLTQDKVVEFIESISPFLNFVIPILFVFTFLGILLVPLFTLLYLFFIALIFLIVSRVMDVKLEYAKLYQVALHIIIIPTTVFGIFALLSIPAAFPFRDTIVLTGLFILILYKIKPQLT